MSRAFVKETDVVDDLPDRLVSARRNLVTPQGLAAIDAELGKLEAELLAAATSPEQRRVVLRDQRYWLARRASAEVVAASRPTETVRFGATVTISGPGGVERMWRIVGEDEANPAEGTIAYSAPLAQNLLGRTIGDTVMAGQNQATIVAIEQTG